MKPRSHFDHMADNHGSESGRAGVWVHELQLRRMQTSSEETKAVLSRSATSVMRRQFRGSSKTMLKNLQTQKKPKDPVPVTLDSSSGSSQDFETKSQR